MNFLLMAMLLAQPWLEPDECLRTGERCRESRNGRPTSVAALFEFAPASGTGMGTTCACATITGTKAEALTFTRSGDATCAKQGMAMSGISDGDLVVCTTDQPRVELSGGVRGLRVESAKTNVLLRFIDIANATWTDVGAPPTIGGGQISPFAGGLSASAQSMDDYSAVLQLGRAQTVTVTAGIAHTLSCYVKGLTFNQVMLSLDGTTAVFSGLPTTSWTRVSVTDVSSSGVAISAQLLIGDVVADTGSVIWGGCQVEAGSYATSIQPTVAAAVTRNAELAGFSVSVPTTAGVCAAATVEVPSTQAFIGGAGLWAPQVSSGAANANVASPYMWPYAVTTGGAVAIDGTGSSGAPSGYNPVTDSLLTLARAVAGHNGTAWAYTYNGTARVAGPASTWASPTYSSVKLFAQTTTESAAIWTRVQVDPSFSRCSL